MSRLRRVWHRLTAAASRRRFDRDFAEEQRAHLQLAADEYERHGLAPDAARRHARLAFGGADAAAELHRDTRGLPLVESVARDLSYAVRGMRRDAGLVTAAVLILAVGIGANTAVFSLVRPILLKPLPFAGADQLVWISNTGDAGLSGATFQVDTYRGLQKVTKSFSDWTAYFAFSGFGNNTLTGAGDPAHVYIADVAPRFFELLGVQPAIGRLFTSSEQTPNGPAAVLIGHDYWQEHFGARPDIVGSYLTINGQPNLVAGVLPASFDFASTFAPGTRVDLVRPAILDTMRPWGNTLSIVARLAPGVSIDQARAELAGAGPALRKDNPSLFPFGTRATPLQEQVSGSMRRPLAVLWGAVGLVLLIVCVNVSSLLIARSTSRTKEFAVRLALGASRGRVFQQLAIEGIMLASVGAVLGIPLAYAMTWWFKEQVSLAVPLLRDVHVDGVVLAAMAVVSVLTGLLFSVVPAVRLARADPQAALMDHSRGSVGSRTHTWTRSSLVVAEIAVASVLLIGTGLLVRSFGRLLDADLGFRPAKSTELALSVSGTRTPAEQTILLSEALRRVRTVPGVEAAGMTDALPLDRNRSWGIGLPGITYPPGQNPATFVYVVSPGYFAAMGMRVVEGRDLADSDTSQSPRVVVISQSLAKILYPNQDAVGRPTAIMAGAPHTIVGIVADVRQTTLDVADASQIYLPQSQGSGVGTDLVVRSTLGRVDLVAAVRHELANFDASLLVTDAHPIVDLVDRSVSPRRFLVSLLTAFSAFAVILASLGIYGVVSYSVSERVQEIGVRMALGATAGNVRWQILRKTLVLGASGLVVGLAASLALGRVVASLLFETSPTDAGTYVASAVVLLLVAAVAGYLPARRASRIPPLRALQQ